MRASHQRLDRFALVRMQRIERPAAEAGQLGRVVRDDEADEFAASVERDLANLPTTEYSERRSR